VAELAALEMLCTGNCTVGSNPTLSAICRSQKSAVRGQQIGESGLTSDLRLLTSVLSGSGRRAIARLRTPPGRERSNGSRSRMCRGLSGA
jgi:hypothetical protein